MDSGTARVGVGLGVLATLFNCLGILVVGLPLAAAALLLGVQSLALRRSAAGFAASGIGLIACFIAVVQFAFQS